MLGISRFIPHLAPKERAKMLYEHKLSMWRLFLDKVIFAAALAIVGLFGYWWVNSSLENLRAEISTNVDKSRNEAAIELESFKQKEARLAFVWQRKLDALAAMTAVQTDIEKVFFQGCNLANNKGASDESLKEKYDKAIEGMLANNKYISLLGTEFDKQAQWFINTHRSIKDIAPEKWHKYLSFVSNLANEFAEMCEAYVDKGAFPENKRLRLDALSYGSYRVGAPVGQAYLDKQLEYRRKLGIDDKVQ